MPVVILRPEQHWACPNCDATAVTGPTRAPTGGGSTQMHHCAGLAGLVAPMLLEGVRAKVEALTREDYEGDSLAQRDGEGRVVMSVVTTREDGQDCTVLAPTATGSLHG
jgi:hypothetical protein